MRYLRTTVSLGIAIALAAVPLAACRQSDGADTTTTAAGTTTTAADTTTSAAGTTTTTAAETTTSALPDSTATTAPDTTGPATTVTAPDPDVVSPAAGTPLVVGLLDEADQLNVRIAADPGADIVARLDPTTVVAATGNADVHDGSIWYEITTNATTGAKTGWANSFYLSEQWGAADFAADPRVTNLMQQLFDVFAARGDLRTVTGRRGLIVSHFDPPRRFKPAELATLLTSTTEYGWGSSACSPEECGTDTFTEAFADQYIQAYDDTDRQVVFDQIIGGGNMMLNPIPAKFLGVHYAAFFDPGDNPDFGGLDWSTWYVYIALEDGEPVIVGLSTDEWAP
jgi:hypothetical protein